MATNSRYIRDTVVLSKIEAVYGTDAVPTGAANAVAVSNVRVTPLNAQFVSRDILRNWFGASENLISSFNKLVSFDVEAVGSGTAGTAPAWGALLRACGFAETAVVSERVTYKPITNGQESITNYVYDSGVLHKLVGAKGAVAIDMGLGNIPKLKFAFVGIDGGDSAATPSGVSIAAYQPPQVVTDQFTSDLILGGTFTPTPGTPGITAGTVYPSKGLQVDMGLKAEYIPLLSSQAVEITDRQAKGQIVLDATPAQEVAFIQAIQAGTLQSVGLVHGTVTGRKFAVFGPNAQLGNLTKEEISGKRLIGLDLVFLPGSAGNDEVQIVASF